MICHCEERSAAKRRSNLLFLAALFISSPCFASPQVCHQHQCVGVEVVTKDVDLERGLMYRTGLDADKGMLFVFKDEGIYKFWMKNMHFALDMLWLNGEGRIVFIAPHVPACVKDPCPVYDPNTKARYVLEVSSGYAAFHHWKRGDQLEFKGI